jgi:hypothetical protein
MTEPKTSDPNATEPLVAEPDATAPLAPPPAGSSAPSTAPRSAPLPPPPARAYSDSPKSPPTAAFVPPELLARRRAAAPPSTPYQPIAGWSLAPAGPMGPPMTAPGGTQPQSGPVAQQPQTNGIQASPSGPANGFANPPTGATGQRGPTTAPGAPVPIVPRSGADEGSPRRPLLIGIAAVVAVAGLVVAGIVVNGALNKDGASATPPAASASAAPVKEPVKADHKVSSFDPLPNGQGFRDKGDFWDTNQYSRPDFGGLKPGVGLVLDLGEPKQVASVTFDARTGPLTVELHALDEKPIAGSIGSKVGKAIPADGETKLDAAKGGRHQYWMIWVTDLGPGRKAVVGDISVLVPAS